MRSAAGALTAMVNSDTAMLATKPSSDTATLMRNAAMIEYQNAWLSQR